MLLSREKRGARLISCHCHLLPSLSAITHPTKVRWLLQEEERESGGDHSAKYNADEAEREREREENVQNGQLQS